MHCACALRVLIDAFWIHRVHCVHCVVSMRSLRCFDTHGGHIYGFDAGHATERGEHNWNILNARAEARSVRHPNRCRINPHPCRYLMQSLHSCRIVLQEDWAGWCDGLMNIILHVPEADVEAFKTLLKEQRECTKITTSVVTICNRSEPSSSTSSSPS